MEFEELKNRVQALITCAVGQEKAIGYAIDDNWLRPIHEDMGDRRNEVVLAQAWMDEVNRRNQPVATLSGVTGINPVNPPLPPPTQPGQTGSEPFPGRVTA